MVVAAEHETDPLNCKTMWDHQKISFGKEYDDVYEESMLFRNFESNVDVICASNAENPTFLKGLPNSPISCAVSGGNCTQVSFCKFME